jgi:hypothetical protein
MNSIMPEHDSHSGSTEATARIEIPGTPETDAVLQAHYEAIGKVAVAWAAFEFHLNVVIWALAGTEQWAGACITYQLSTIQSKARAMLALFRLHEGNEEVARRLNKFFANDADPVSQERNRLIHDPLAIDRDRANKVFRLPLTADKKLASKLKDTPLEDANSTLQKIIKITHQFDGLRNEIFSSLPTSAKIKPIPRA